MHKYRGRYCDLCGSLKISQSSVGKANLLIINQGILQTVLKMMFLIRIEIKNGSDHICLQDQFNSWFFEKQCTRSFLNKKLLIRNSVVRSPKNEETPVLGR